MRSLKKQAVSLLENNDFQGLMKLSDSPHKLVNILITLTYDKKDRISWRAMEAIGLLTGRLSESDPDAVRNIVGRLLWMIRDESGGIGWSVPEILGEIVKNSPVLCEDIAPIIASFHEEKMLTSGVLWAMARIGRINEDTVRYAAPLFLPYLDAPDHTVRGYAAYALGELRSPEASDRIKELKNDGNTVDFYEDGELKELTVGDIASSSIDKIIS